jgi:hypothetical protein
VRQGVIPVSTHNPEARRNVILNIESLNYKDKRAILDELAFDDDATVSLEELQALRNLLKDESRYIRSQTASLLARFSKWPDSQLSSAFDRESERSTKITMFQTILELRGVPFHIALRETENIEREGIDPNFKIMEQIISQDK